MIDFTLQRAGKGWMATLVGGRSIAGEGSTKHEAIRRLLAYTASLSPMTPPLP